MEIFIKSFRKSGSQKCYVPGKQRPHFCQLNASQQHLIHASHQSYHSLHWVSHKKFESCLACGQDILSQELTEHLMVLELKIKDWNKVIPFIC